MLVFFLVLNFILVYKQCLIAGASFSQRTIHFLLVNVNYLIPTIFFCSAAWLLLVPFYCRSAPHPRSNFVRLWLSSKTRLGAFSFFRFILKVRITKRCTMCAGFALHIHVQIMRRLLVLDVISVVQCIYFTSCAHLLPSYRSFFQAFSLFCRCAARIYTFSHRHAAFCWEADAGGAVSIHSVPSLKRSFHNQSGFLVSGGFIIFW